MSPAAISPNTKYFGSIPMQWTPTGLECQAIKANCGQCPINKFFGLHKESSGEAHCHQARYNARLLAEGVEPGQACHYVSEEIKNRRFEN